MNYPRLIPYFNDPAKAEENKQKYRSFDHEKIHAPFYRNLRAVINESRSNGRTVRVLDVGSGTGENARLMADMGAHVVAVEPAAAMQRFGGDLYAHQHIQLVVDAMPSLSTTRELASNDNKFDVVLISASLQYVAPDDLKEALGVIAEVTKPNGLIRITYPTPPSRKHQYAIPPNASNRRSQRQMPHCRNRCACRLPTRIAHGLRMDARP
jgi:SAM-dependent methyltransferase